MEKGMDGVEDMEAEVAVAVAVVEVEEEEVAVEAAVAVAVEEVDKVEVGVGEEAMGREVVIGNGDAVAAENQWEEGKASPLLSVPKVITTLHGIDDVV